MLDYVLVALMTVTPGQYDFETVKEYASLEQCKKELPAQRRTAPAGTASLVCAKRDWN